MKQSQKKEETRELRQQSEKQKEQGVTLPVTQYTYTIITCIISRILHCKPINM